MASGSGSLIAILAVGIGGWYAYSKGWLCQFGLCPGDFSTQAESQHPAFQPGHEAGHSGRQRRGTIGYGDDGYGDYSGYGSEYGFDANVAHISIA